MDCGGKRSATPLWIVRTDGPEGRVKDDPAIPNQSAVVHYYAGAVQKRPHVSSKIFNLDPDLLETDRSKHASSQALVATCPPGRGGSLPGHARSRCRSRLDLTRAVVVAPASFSASENKAVQMLIEEVEKRTQIRLARSAKPPARLHSIDSDQRAASASVGAKATASPSRVIPSVLRATTRAACCLVWATCCERCA